MAACPESKPAATLISPPFPYIYTIFTPSSFNTSLWNPIHTYFLHMLLIIGKRNLNYEYVHIWNCCQHSVLLPPPFHSFFFLFHLAIFSIFSSVAPPNSIFPQSRHCSLLCEPFVGSACNCTRFLLNRSTAYSRLRCPYLAIF